MWKYFKTVPEDSGCWLELPLWRGFTAFKMLEIVHAIPLYKNFVVVVWLCSVF